MTSPRKHHMPRKGKPPAQNALTTARRTGVLLVAVPPPGSSVAEMYVVGLAPGSRRAQAAALVRLARMLGADDPRRVAWWQITPPIVDAIRAQLSDEAAPATVNRVLSAL